MKKNGTASILLVLFVVLAGVSALVLLPPTARAADGEGRGWSVEWQGKTTNYPYGETWRGHYTQANFVMQHERSGLKVTYYGNFRVTERER